MFACTAALVIVAPACFPGPGPKPDTPAPATPVPLWEAEWERAITAAKQEGQLVVAGPDGDTWRRLAESFQEEFPEIVVEFAPSDTEDFFGQLLRDRQNGIYAWDVRVGGLEVDVFRAKDAGALTPVRPMLFHGLVVDDSNWMGGLDGLFRFDREHQWLAGFQVQITSSVWVNRATLESGEPVSARDLLDPQWRGKMVLLDPRRDVGTLTLLLDAYGESFVRDLLRGQAPLITADAREQSDWVIRGEYPIGIGYTTDLARRFLLQGQIVPVQPVSDGPIGISPGNGSVQAIDRPPHPNAQRVFVNWLLTPIIQDRLAAVAGANSLRLDAHPGDPFVRPDPRFFDAFVCHVCEDMLPVRAEARRLAVELLR